MNTKIADISISDGDGLILGHTKKRVVFNTSCNGETLLFNWFQSYLRGVRSTKSKELNFVISIKDDVVVNYSNIF